MRYLLNDRVVVVKLNYPQTAIQIGDTGTVIGYDQDNRIHVQLDRLQCSIWFDSNELFNVTAAATSQQ